MAADEHHVAEQPSIELKKTRSVPRYALPNAAWLLPEYVNEGADYIHKTFHSGNYNYLRRLPEKIDDHSVTAARRDIQEQPFTSAGRSKSSAKGYTAKGRLFKDFEYIPTPFLDSPPRSDRTAAPEGRAPFIVPKEASLKPRYADYHFVEGEPEAQAYVDQYDVSRLEERSKRSLELFGPFVPPSSKCRHWKNYCRIAAGSRLISFVLRVTSSTDMAFRIRSSRKVH